MPTLAPRSAGLSHGQTPIASTLGICYGFVIRAFPSDPPVRLGRRAPEQRRRRGSAHADWRFEPSRPAVRPAGEICVVSNAREKISDGDAMTVAVTCTTCGSPVPAVGSREGSEVQPGAISRTRSGDAPRRSSTCCSVGSISRVDFSRSHPPRRPNCYRALISNEPSRRWRRSHEPHQRRPARQRLRSPPRAGRFRALEPRFRTGRDVLLTAASGRDGSSVMSS